MARWGVNGASPLLEQNGSQLDNNTLECYFKKTMYIVNSHPLSVSEPDNQQSADCLTIWSRIEGAWDLCRVFWSRWGMEYLSQLWNKQKKNRNYISLHLFRKPLDKKWVTCQAGSPLEQVWTRLVVSYFFLPKLHQTSNRLSLKKQPKWIMTQKNNESNSCITSHNRGGLKQTPKDHYHLHQS